MENDRYICKEMNLNNYISEIKTTLNIMKRNSQVMKDTYPTLAAEP
jgi:hypothetical protein